MATAEQIKALIRSHLEDDRDMFITTALQVAAHEARQGHTQLAHEIRLLVDKARTAVVIKLPADLSGLVITEHPNVPLQALVLDDATKDRIQRIILEYYQRSKLKSHGLSHRRKILLAGDPGTGKTMTAKVLACELRLPLHTIQMDRLITKFMGESSAKLRQIFDRVREVQGVYLFDEFDAIGGDRTLDNDVGEMRRVLAAFLQFIEHDVSDNLIVAATNTPQLLDAALFRRFDDVLYYDLPSEKERSRLIVNVLGTYFDQTIDLGEAVAVSAGLSHAEIDRACRDAIKEAILKDEHKVESHSLVTMFRERHGAYLGNRGGRGE